ncbi:MAG TPA: hypothetical protein VJL54_09480 [Nitrososphaera sp.]|nr:hypothetical protein [Nitrososphaera sp.]
MAENGPPSFPCGNCGRSFVAKPPYDGFEVALTKPCDKKDHDAPQLYVCEECRHRNVIYWCQSK